MSNDIEALRTHLFETLAALKDKDNPMDIDRAKAVSEVAQVIINTAKVEVDFAKATGAKTSGFLEKKPELPPGITGIVQHRIKG
jgi:hypothetical protein